VLIGAAGAVTAEALADGLGECLHRASRPDQQPSVVIDAGATVP
jgi:hypothetical protein